MAAETTVIARRRKGGRIVEESRGMALRGTIMVPYSREVRRCYNGQTSPISIRRVER
ncbi:hypothetical protein PLICRDRAFT_39901 [Plicaturopsis crispa FD-325 SS-3]|nr:hypothetical protein PLICRDRAFT_39901 [Plicaturopsis crispa FD-325 SS-3]